jgi:hypothetical protein
MGTKKLSAAQTKELLHTLQTRFENNKSRHKGIEFLPPTVSPITFRPCLHVRPCVLAMGHWPATKTDTKH